MWRRFKAYGRAIAIVVGVITALVGLALLVLPLLPGGLATDRYALAGAYLLYSAALILRETFSYRVETGRWLLDLIGGFVFDDIALMGTGLISAALVVKAFGAGTASPWIFGLAAPALVALTYTFTDGRKKAQPDAAVNEVAIEPESGKLYRGAYIIASLSTAVWTAFTCAIQLAIIGLGVCLWLLLDQCLFGTAAVGISQVVAFVAPFFRRLAPLAVVMAGFMAGLMFVIGLVTMAYHWLSLAGHHDANRNLTSREVVFIETAAKDVRAYGEAKGYVRRDWRTVVLLTILYVVMGAAGAFALFKGFVPGGAPPVHTASGLYLYLPPDTGPSGVLVVFTLCLMIPLPSYLLSAVWRYYSEYSTWRGLALKASEYATLKGRLTNFVRTDRLRPGEHFDAGAFLHRAGQSLGRLTLLPLLPMAALTAWFYWLDCSNFDLLTDRSITVVHYWTGQPVQYPYSAVRGIELGCSYGKNDNLDFSYSVLLPDGYEVDVTHTLRRGRTLSAVMDVDDKLRELSVPVTYTVRKPLWQDPVWGYDPRCVRELAGEFSGEDSKRILRLFRVTAWEEKYGY
jgi:hypothetical protein